MPTDFILSLFMTISLAPYAGFRSWHHDGVHAGACFQTGAQNSLHMQKYYGSVSTDLWDGSGKVLFGGHTVFLSGRLNSSTTCGKPDSVII